MTAEQEKILELRAALKPFADCYHDRMVYQGNPNAMEVEVGNFAYVCWNDIVRAAKLLQEG